MDSITDFQQKLYNLYLSALAEKQGRGFRNRYRWDNLDTAALVTLIKLEQFFKSNENINPSDFFKAGFELSPENWLPIEHFKTRKAIAQYTKYMRGRAVADPDTADSLTSYVEGIKFILNFVKENQLNLNQYKEAKNGVGVPYYMIHLHDQKISFYHLHTFDISLSEVPQDYKNLVFNNFDDTFNRTQSAYLSSVRMIQIGNKIKTKLRK